MHTTLLGMVSGGLISISGGRPGGELGSRCDTDDHLGGCGRQPGLEGVDEAMYLEWRSKTTPVWGGTKSALHCALPCPVKNSLETLESW